MSELIEHWKPIAQLFQSVRAEYPAGWFVQRSGRTVEDLERDVTDVLSAYPGGWPHVVLVGNRGSGKTFHLRRFLDLVASRGQWFPVFLDLERTFEVQSLKAGAIDGLQPWELVLLAMAIVYRAIPQEFRDREDDATIRLIEKATNELAGPAGGAVIDLGKVAAGIVGIAAQVATGVPTAGLATIAFSGATRWTVPLSGGPAVSPDDPRARRLLEVSNDWLRRVSARLHRQVVLVLDGVDRANAEDEGTTRRLLVADTALSRLDCPVVCAAGPIWYRFNTAPESSGPGGRRSSPTSPSRRAPSRGWWFRTASRSSGTSVDTASPQARRSKRSCRTARCGSSPTTRAAWCASSSACSIEACSSRCMAGSGG